MTKFEQIIEFAIEREREAVSFYEDLAKIVINPAAIEMLSEFRAMECEHLNILQSIKPDALLKFDIDEIDKLNLSDYFVEVVPNQELTYQQLITLAIQKESASYSLYMALSNTTADMEAKLFFIGLADQEIKHKLKLESIYDDVIYKEN